MMESHVIAKIEAVDTRDSNEMTEEEARKHFSDMKIELHSTD
jgi:hypothetical protein